MKKFVFWCIALLVWIVSWHAVELCAMERHNQTPGGYRAPAKVAERKQLKIIALSGKVGLVVCVLLSRHAQKKQETSQK